MTRFGKSVVAALLIFACSCIRAYSSGDQIEFDEFFLSGLRAPLFDAEGAVDPRAKLAVARAMNKRGNPDLDRESFAVFIEILKYFVEYVRAFERETDRSYASIGDFRGRYVHKVQSLPGMAVQAETFRTTIVADGFRARTEGGGAGVRVDLQPSESGTLSLLLMPLYGEKTSLGATEAPGPTATQFVARVNAGIGYEAQLSDRADAGVQVLYQPQIIDLGQFRVYAEAYMRLRFYRQTSSSKGSVRLSEISLLPKVVYWKSTDHEGIFGDSIEARLGDASYKLSEHVYGFCNVEFRFRM